MGTKAQAAAPAQTVALYEKLIATHPGVERKGAMLPYTSVNGNMFSVLTKTGALALRLPEAERDAFLKKYKTGLSEQYGVVMKEYVEVPDALLKRTAELARYFAVSVEYAEGLRPKATTKKTPPGKNATKMSGRDAGGRRK